MDTRYKVLVYIRLVHKLSIISRQLWVNIDAFIRTRILLHNRRHLLQKVINDIQKKLKAPVLLILKHVMNNLIRSQRDLKIEYILNRQRLGLNQMLDDLNGISVQLLVPDLEIVRNDRDEVDVAHYGYKCRVLLYDDGQELEAKEGYGVRVGQDDAVFGEQLFKDEGVQAFGKVVVADYVVNGFV